MPEVKLGRDKTSENLTALILLYANKRKKTRHDLMEIFGVASYQRLQKFLDAPLGEPLGRILHGCMKLGISREELLAAIDYKKGI